MSIKLFQGNSYVVKILLMLHYFTTELLEDSNFKSPLYKIVRTKRPFATNMIDIQRANDFIITLLSFPLSQKSN